MELKEALSSKYGHLSTSDVQSSKLWTHLKKPKSRAKTLPVVIVAMSEIDCDAKQGTFNFTYSIVCLIECQLWCTICLWSLYIYIILFMTTLQNHAAEDGMYNAVWDDKILLCYDLLQCQCSKVIGVSIHSTSGDENMQSLVGKVSVYK